VIGEVQRLLGQSVNVDAAVLTRCAARMLKHAANDSVGALAMLDDLRKVIREGVDDFIDLSLRLRAKRGYCRIHRIPQLLEQLARQARKIVDEVQRVLDLVGDTGG